VTAEKSGIDIRDGYFDTVFELAQKSSDLVFLSADADAHSLVKFRKAFPDRYINVGVAEQNMITVAAGLALAGKKVFVYSLLPFLAMRCFEQIHFNIVGMKLPVSFVGVGAGYSFDFDGPSHHGLIDIGLFRLLPGFTILNPSTADLSSKCAKFSYYHDGPTLTRLDKGSSDDVNSNTDFDAGFDVLRKGEDVVILSTGRMVHSAIIIAETLERNGLSAGVIDLFRLKPLDTQAIAAAIAYSRTVVSLDENSAEGGLGILIDRVMRERSLTTPVKYFSCSDKIMYQTGSRRFLLEKEGLGIEEVSKKVLEFFRSVVPDKRTSRV
jgi:transketolase